MEVFMVKTELLKFARKTHNKTEQISKSSENEILRSTKLQRLQPTNLPGI